MHSTDDVRKMIYGLDTLVKTYDGKKSPVINLDNAATTPPFIKVMRKIQKELKMYGSIGRGEGQKSTHSSDVYVAGRGKIKEFFGLNTNDKDYTVVYTASTTDGMNKLASALVEHEKGDFKVLSTRMEHHANDLPWRERVGIDRMLFAEVDEDGRLMLNHLEKLLDENKGKVKYVTVNAAANVTGYVNDVHKIAQLAHKHGAKIIVDGAQIVAHREFKMRDEEYPDGDIDFFLFSAHKMYSPYGGGALIGRTDILAEHMPCFYGGGIVKEVTDTKVNYVDPPDLYEAGSPNYPGIVGMLKAMDILKNIIGFNYITNHEQELLKQTIDGLKQVREIKLYGDNENYADRVGVVVFNIGRIGDDIIAKALATYGAVAVRHAKFCAHPYVDRLLGKVVPEGDSGVTACFQSGMVRVSFGAYTTKAEIEFFLELTGDIAEGKYPLDALVDTNLLTTHTIYNRPRDRG